MKLEEYQENESILVVGWSMNNVCQPASILFKATTYLFTLTFNKTFFVFIKYQD